MSFKITRLLVAGIVIFVVGILGYFLLSGQSQARKNTLEIIVPSPLETEGLIRIAPANPLNDSDQKGKVYWRDDNGKVTVTVSISPGKSNDPQPAFLQSGDCNTPGETKYNLNSVIDGNSQTVLEVSLSEFESQLPLTMTIHTSQTDDALASCAQITKGSEVVDPFGVYSSSGSAN